MRIRPAVCILSVALLGAVLATPAVAQAQGRGRGEVEAQGRGRGEANQDRSDGKRAAPPAEATTPVRYGFASRDRDVIRRYFTQTSGLPPGLARREGSLPPGLEKQLERNGTLPPGLEKEIHPFPADLDRQLTSLPAGYRRGIVGPHLVVYESKTQKIIDVIRDIVR